MRNRPEYDGCCSGHNTLVNQLPTRIPNAYAISASGLNGLDDYHFDLPGQRDLGTRYGSTMLEALGLLSTPESPLPAPGARTNLCVGVPSCHHTELSIESAGDGVQV